METNINLANWSPAERPTDAEVAARWAAEALTDGRYELGRVLANIASTAHRIEQDARPAPVAVSMPDLYTALAEPVTEPCTDQWQPPHEARTAPYACATCAAAEAPTDGPTGDGNADVPALASDAQTELFGPPAQTQLAVPASARCAYLIVKRGSDLVKHSETCNRPIYWWSGSTEYPPQWRHVDPAYDQDHGPVAPAPEQ